MARVLKVNHSVLKSWNPDLISSRTIASLKRPLSVYLDKSVDLKGAGTKIASLKRRLVKRLAKTSKKRGSKSLAKTTHLVRKGENLTLIAKRYQTSISQLKKTNKLNRRGAIRIGQKLKVPSRNIASSKIYKVRIGDNLIKIARKFKIPVRRLKSFNGLTHSKIYPKQKLRIPING